MSHLLQVEMKSLKLYLSLFFFLWREEVSHSGDEEISRLLVVRNKSDPVQTLFFRSLLALISTNVYQGLTPRHSALSSVFEEDIVTQSG